MHTLTRYRQLKRKSLLLSENLSQTNLSTQTQTQYNGSSVSAPRDPGPSAPPPPAAPSCTLLPVVTQPSLTNGHAMEQVQQPEQHHHQQLQHHHHHHHHLQLQSTLPPQNVPGIVSQPTANDQQQNYNKINSGGRRKKNYKRIILYIEKKQR